jgi:hypothetical protein
MEAGQVLGHLFPAPIRVDLVERKGIRVQRFSVRRFWVEGSADPLASEEAWLIEKANLKQVNTRLPCIESWVNVIIDA